MFEMKANGVSCFKIAKTLNDESIPTKSGEKWGGSVVSRILRNTAYYGLTYFGQTLGNRHKKTAKESWYALPDVTPAIISQDLFERVQVTMAKSREIHCGKAKHEYPLSGFAICGYCGSPLVGHYLRGGYRYYHCRGAYHTPSRKKTCDAHYIKADWLESVVWEKVQSILSNPELLLMEVKKQTDLEQSQVSNGDLDKEIKVLNRKIKGYEGQERRLMSVLRLDVVKSDIVLDELNQMKKELEADKNRLSSLIKTKENIDKMVDMEAHLKELCDRIAPDVDNCTYQDKKDAYTYLDLKVTATPDSVDIKGYLDPSVMNAGSCLPMMGQTSG